METGTMGRVVTGATIESLEDLWAAGRGLIPSARVRRVTVPDALVKIDAASLFLPTAVIRQLGLSRMGSKQVRSSTGLAVAARYEAVRLTIQGRDCVLDVLEVPDGVPVLIGQIPLALLDFVVDLGDRQLIGNPAHGGELVYEMY